MKKAFRKQVAPPEPEMRREYRLDYGEARPNRFATEVPRDAVAVVLDPDVGSVFGSSDSVNAFLRSAIKAMPVPAGRRRKAG